MFLALRPEKASIAEISRAFGVSQNHLTKVVHHLGKLGFIVTMRGRGGGIRLARAPATIVMGDVTRKTEPSWTVVECFDKERNTCPIANAGCGLKGAVAAATAQFLATLDGYTLEDVLVQPRKLRSVLKLPDSEAR